MSLATRCTACGTVFRVVQDQLKVSEGWVRCGRCNAVFSALEGLFDLEREAPPDVSEASVVALEPPAFEPPPVEPLIIEPLSPGGEAARDEAAHTAVPLKDPVVSGRFTARRPEPGTTPAERIDARDRLDFPDAQFDSELAVDGSESGEPEAGSTALGETSAAVQAPPEFLQRAQRQERWRKPWLRVGLASLVIALAAALAAQSAYHFRDSIAARYPALEPLFTAACAALGCSVDAPRRIDAVSVENTALARAVAPGDFRLALTLRNRAAVALMLPSVELSLTDASGRLVARRALAPRDFNALPVLAAGSEAALQIMLATAGASGTDPVSGYTVELFYP